MLGKCQIRECACHLWTSESGEMTKKGSRFSPPPFTALFYAGLSNFWQDSPPRLPADFSCEMEKDLMHVELHFEIISLSNFRHNGLLEEVSTSDWQCRLIFTKRNKSDFYLQLGNTIANQTDLKKMHSVAECQISTYLCFSSSLCDDLKEEKTSVRTRIITPQDHHIAWDSV